MFGGVDSLLVHSLILGEEASCLGFFDWIRYVADCFEAWLDWPSCAKIDWSDDYSHFCHDGLMTSNHGFAINAIDSKPIELLLAGGLVLALFQSLAHVRFVIYYGPIISQRNQLF